MNEVQTIFQRIQVVANELYTKYTHSQQEQLAPERERTNELLAQHSEALGTLRELFLQHGFGIATTPFTPPEIEGVKHRRIGASPTFSGFAQVWQQFLNQYVHSDPTPRIHAKFNQINAEITHAITQIHRDHARFTQVFADTYFVASLNAPFNTPTTPSMLLLQLINAQSLVQHLPNGTFNVYIPHPALLQWALQQPQPSPHAYLLAWYTTPSTDYGTDYLDVLNLVFAPTTTRHPQPVSYDQWPLQAYNETAWRPINIPSSTLITQDNERLRTRKFGNLRHKKAPYTFAYGFIPNEYSQEHGYESEDVLLFEVDDKDFIIIVSDGVSQSCMGSIGALSVTQMLHVVWQTLKQDNAIYDEAYLNSLIKRALYTAKIDANTKVSSRLYSDDFQKNVSERIWRVLESLYQGGGTQSTFSCVFCIRGCLYAISMGNSGILIQGKQSGDVLHPDDGRFQSDNIRFSSGERTGMRGEPFISIYPTFLTDNESWRIVIHSDALAEYKDRASLYSQELKRPSHRPLDLDDDLLAACISVDDTTIIELFCDNKKSPSASI